MIHPDGQERARFVQSMFTRIAPRYTLMNRLMTGGQDVRWRREVIRLARLNPGDSLLDLGTGSGDLAFEAVRQNPGALVIAADFTLEMMRVGRQNGSMSWSAADALHLPFGDQSFNAVVSGFLMRNVIDLHKGLQEQYRILKPNGRIVILDTTRPKRNFLSPLIRFHMQVIIPALGGLLSGHRDAYHYLPDSTEGFVTAEEMAVHMTTAGFKKIQFKRLMFGTIAMHWGEK